MVQLLVSVTNLTIRRRPTGSGVGMPFFLVAEFAVGGPVGLAGPPTLTCLPEADTPVLWVDSLPRVGRRRVEASPEVGRGSPSAELGIVSLTRSSRELVLGPADTFPLPIPFPFALTLPLERSFECPLPLMATDLALEGDIMP
jgi:hypothetical protein